MPLTKSKLSILFTDSFNKLKAASSMLESIGSKWSFDRYLPSLEDFDIDFMGLAHRGDSIGEHVLNYQWEKLAKQRYLVGGNTHIPIIKHHVKILQLTIEQAKNNFFVTDEHLTNANETQNVFAAIFISIQATLDLCENFIKSLDEYIKELEKKEGELNIKNNDMSKNDNQLSKASYQDQKIKLVIKKQLKFVEESKKLISSGLKSLTSVTSGIKKIHSNLSENLEESFITAGHEYRKAASINGHHKEIMELACGKTIGSKGKDSKKTAIHQAVQRGIYDNFSLLLELGENTNGQDKFGDTPLHLAANTQHNHMKKIDWKAIKILMKYGADPHIKNNKNISVADILLKNKEKNKIMSLNRSQSNDSFFPLPKDSLEKFSSVLEYKERQVLFKYA